MALTTRFQPGYRLIDGSELNAAFEQVAAQNVSTDTFSTIVVGATEAGCMAARAAADMGRRVLITSDEPWFGWMSSGYGLNQQDVKGTQSPAVLGGATREFWTQYAEEGFFRHSYPNWWKVEGPMRPNQSKVAWAALLDHPNITKLPNASLTALTKEGTRITSLTFLVDGTETQVFYPRVVVEGTACGDVNQRALTSYSIGRESNSLYGETINGIRNPTKWDNNTDVDPYVVPGDPSSGLLFGVDPAPLGTVGDGDGRVMGFCYRLFLTSVAGDIIPWSEVFGGIPPDDYRASNYELLGRAFAANPTYYGNSTLGLGRVIQMYNLNAGTGTAMGPTFITYVDGNSSGPLSLNYPVTDIAREYITASPTRRRQIDLIAKNYQMGFLYWLLYENDARIPATIRTALGAYGFSRYQLAETGGFSAQFYQREGARAVGDFVLDQNDAVLNNGLTDVIAYGYYDFDSHPVRRLVSGGLVYTEGALLTSLGAGYGYRVPMRVLFPKVAECTNLVCASQPSVSRVAWLDLRVAGSMMMIGTAGGVVAALADILDIDVQDVPYQQVALYCDPKDIGDGTVVDVSGTYGNGVITLTGANWVPAASSRYGGVGEIGGLPVYSTVLAANVAGHSAKGELYVYSPGWYDLFFGYSADVSVANGGQGRATNLSVSVITEQGTTTQTISQQVGGNSVSNGGRWEYLGRYKLRYGIPSADYFNIDCTGADGQVTVSALKISSANGGPGA